jgi:hypothetical protein
VAHVHLAFFRMFISFLIAIFYQQQIYCIHHTYWVSDY